MFEVKPLPFAYDKLKGISEQTNKFHHDKHYAAYVNARNKVEAKLKEMREKADFTGIRGLKQSESHNASGQILHEIYYETLGGNGSVDESLQVIKKIIEDFGSFDIFKKELRETAKSARGWSLVCYDYSDKKLHVYLVDFHDQGAVWGAVPILALDMWEHAFYHDQGPNKGAYIEAFMQNLNWGKVNELYLKVNK